MGPGEELRAAHLRVVRGEVSGASPGPTPAELPADVIGFSGRAPELARLDLLADSLGPGQVVAAIPWGRRDG